MRSLPSAASTSPPKIAAAFSSSSVFQAVTWVAWTSWWAAISGGWACVRLPRRAPCRCSRSRDRSGNSTNGYGSGLRRHERYHVRRQSTCHNDRSKESIRAHTQRRPDPYEPLILHQSVGVRQRLRPVQAQIGASLIEPRQIQCGNHRLREPKRLSTI